MTKCNNTIKIDIHGMYVDNALETLRQRIASVPRNTEKIIVVHGYNNGTALQEAVRRRLHSPRILEVQARIGNDGESIIWLKK